MTTHSTGGNESQWTVTVCHQCGQAGRHGDECPFPGDYVMFAEGDEVVVVPAAQVERLRKQVRDLDELVSRFCVAAGEPVPVDAIAAIKDRMDVLRRLREQPSRCDDDDT